MRRLPIDHLPPLRDAARAGGRTRYRLTGAAGRALACVAVSLLLFSCGFGRQSSSQPSKEKASKQAAKKESSKQPAIGVAYTGPATVNLREDLGPRANAVATLQHGERLEVLETRRRFVRVRTAKGLEGWTDSNYLLSQQQVADLDRLAAFAAKLPSQGAGTTYDALNVHTAPNRQAPSFAQIPEGGKVEVLLHRISPRVAAMPAAEPPKKSKAKTAAKAPAKAAKQGKEPPPPPPPAPPPPADWVDLSRPRLSDLPEESAKVLEAPAPKILTDDWYLVRTADGKAGWVLARQISMSIPDEVAQYAEGHVITGYLSLGKVGADKDNWLWTTSTASVQGQDFDSFRVFVWSTKRGRYETAYIERNVKGRYPIQLEHSAGEDGAAFSVVLQDKNGDKDGQFYKRTYAFSGYRVKMLAKVPYQEPPLVPDVRSTGGFTEEPPAVSKVSWADKLRNVRKRWFGR